MEYILIQGGQPKTVEKFTNYSGFSTKVEKSENRKFCFVRYLVLLVLKLCVIWFWTRIFNSFYNWALPPSKYIGRKVRIMTIRWRWSMLYAIVIYNILKHDSASADNLIDFVNRRSRWQKRDCHFYATACQIWFALNEKYD